MYPAVLVGFESSISISKQIALYTSLPFTSSLFVIFDSSDADGCGYSLWYGTKNKITCYQYPLVG
jgi:hypothetical protein